MKLLASTLLLASAASATSYFKDTFDSLSNWKASTIEKFSGKWELADGGVKTSQDAKFYALTADFEKTFDNTGKDTVIQFSVKHGQKIDCGGGYVKVFPKGLDGATLDDESKETYSLMFGPDICGYSTKKVHFIVDYDGKQHQLKKDVKCEDDTLTHVYTLIMKPDQTYVIKIDGEEKASGNMLEDFDFLPPKEILDPSKPKPADWVDEEMMDDPNDTKPEGYDDIPAQIVDPEAEQPEDWDEESDGEYEAPMIDNPEYKGPWKPKRIKNPDYKGPYEQPKIANPDYKEDDSIYNFKDLNHIAFDLWQVKAGSVFDNVFIGDDADEAQKFADKTFSADDRAAEKKALEEAEAAKKAEEEAKKAEEEAKKAKEDEEDDEEDDEEEESSEKDEL